MIRSGDASTTERSAIVTEGSIEVRVMKRPGQTLLGDVRHGGLDLERVGEARAEAAQY